MHPIFNSVSDLQQFHDLVLGGYHQVDVGMLPAHLQQDLAVLTVTLSEGMQEECARIRLADQGKEESPLVQAEKEYYMDLYRKQITVFGPDYEDGMKEYSFESEGY